MCDKMYISKWPKWPKSGNIQKIKSECVKSDIDRHNLSIKCSFLILQ